MLRNSIWGIETTRLPRIPQSTAVEIVTSDDHRFAIADGPKTS